MVTSPAAPVSAFGVQFRLPCEECEVRCWIANAPFSEIARMQPTWPRLTADLDDRVPSAGGASIPLAGTLQPERSVPATRAGATRQANLRCGFCQGEPGNRPRSAYPGGAARAVDRTAAARATCCFALEMARPVRTIAQRARAKGATAGAPSRGAIFWLWRCVGRVALRLV